MSEHHGEERWDATGADDRSPAEYWENEYVERRWSGRVNPTMADVVASLSARPGGAALDLGCGEGGDAVWLAEQGWQVTAVDISVTAIARGAAGAAEKGVADKITWIGADLSVWTTDETFDLVTASFFHSTVKLSRTEALRRAAGRLCPGGHLLIVSHVFEDPSDIPPWALHHHGTDDPDDAEMQKRLSVLLTPDEEVAELALDESQWEIVTCRIREREATGPDGHQTAIVKDGVLLVRRRAE